MSLTAIAMSGGLDSSVTAWLLADEDRSVVGLSMLLWEDTPSAADERRCCGALDLGDARRVATQIGIPHYVLEMQSEFRRHVVEPFVDAYLAGSTPVPCTACNTWIKFDLLLEKARQVGAERVATGHYARIVEGEDGLELHAAADPAKDQSYYLFELSQEQLGRAEFPLGELSKTDVRELARQAGLIVAEKGESMELCFVSGSIQEFVEAELARRGEPRARPSTVVDEGGAELGEAGPYYRYTVGQRRGLGISSNERRYVKDVNPERNLVTLGGRDDLTADGLIGAPPHWIGAQPANDAEVEVRIRARHRPVPARLVSVEGGVRVEFAEPQFGVTPGQAAVFYRGTRVLGGCWIRDRWDRASTAA